MSDYRYPDSTSCRPPLKPLAAALVATWLLSACSGGGDSPAPALVAEKPPVSATVQFNGIVLDGPIEGAQVFLDLNNNQVRDSNEPISPPSAANGAFTLVADRLSAAQAATAMLVTHIPDTARDLDDGGSDLRAAGRRGFTLMTPASAYLDVAADGGNTAKSPLLSPLTTLVGAEMALNGLTLAEAKSAVGRQLGLEQKDPMTNFATSGDRAMGSLARAVAITLGETGKSVSDVARTQGGQSVREHVAATVAGVKAAVPSLLPVVNANAGSATPLPVAAVVASTASITSAGAEGGKSAQTFRNYVVVFKQGSNDSKGQAEQIMNGRGGKVTHTFSKVVQGFAVTLPDAAADAFLEAMDRHPLVERVEIDQPLSLSQTTQSNATWGLDRVDQRDMPLSGSYTYGSSGSGVHAYVVDTGIYASHGDFAGRVAPGYTAINDTNGTSDCNGHGTHVAGTIGAATWGVAKGATLVPVRVLDCAGSGTLSGVIAGLDWIAANARKPAVVNMSLGAGASSTLDHAVANVVASGITVVVAAGNDAADACYYSPARAPSALTVGASTSSDARASYSNFGTCLDVFAPGSSIKSAWHGSTTATNTISGTSMASPHVAGMVAQLLAVTPGASPSQLADSIKASATASKLSSVGAGSPNLLLFTGANASQEAPPQASITASIASLSGSGSFLRNGWRATVALTVKDANGVAVPGALVVGSFSVGGSSVSCTTSVSGGCSIVSGNLSKRTTETVFRIEGISGTGLTYDPTANAINTVTILKP